MKILVSIIRNLLLFSLLFISSQLYSQSNEIFLRTDAVYLKNGSVFRGQIESFEVGKTLKLRINADKVITFDAVNIKKVIQGLPEAETATAVAEVEKEYAFREKGMYYAVAIGYIGGNSQFGKYTNGFNAHIQTGYQLNRVLGIGIGTGVDFYNVNLGSVIPVYAEIRGYLKAANMSPFYAVSSGIGFPIKNENSFFKESEPGLYVAPSLGLRIGGSSEANMTIALGLQLQKATYSNDSDIGGDFPLIVDTYTFKRFNFTVGVIF